MPTATPAAGVTVAAPTASSISLRSVAADNYLDRSATTIVSG